MRINVFILLFAACIFCTCTEKNNNEPDEDDFSGNSGTFIDGRDGIEYKWIRIGIQIWMSENLAYLPSVSPSAVGSETEPYYYVYDYEGSSVSEAKATSNYETFGVLYNWTAAIEACPDGWHLPTDDEWKQLEMYLGMSQSEADNTGYRGIDEGSKLAGNSDLWYEGDLKNNAEFGSSGFIAPPGGVRNEVEFYYISFRSFSWSVTESSANYAWYRFILYNYCKVGRHYANKEIGFSVRCVKDQ